MAREHYLGVRVTELRARVMDILDDHVGKPNAISATALYKATFEREPDDPITATRCLRELIRDLRLKGKRICSVSNSTGGGYYKPSTKGELKEFWDRFHSRALSTLAQEATMKRVALPELLGQLSLRLWKEAAAAGGQDNAA